MTAPANTSKDPFSRLEEAIWATLVSFAPLTALVNVGNMVNLTGPDDQPFKPSMVGGDVPELLLLQTGGEIKERTSSGRTWVQRYALGIVSDQLRTNTPQAINPVKWAVFRALSLAEVAGKLPGLPFVTSIDFANFTDSMADPSPIDRKVRGWKTVIEVSANLRFSHAEMIA